MGFLAGRAVKGAILNVPQVEEETEIGLPTSWPHALITRALGERQMPLHPLSAMFQSEE